MYNELRFEKPKDMKRVMKFIFSKIKHFFTKIQDIVLTDFRYLLPCALKWFYHRKIKMDIFHFQLKNDSGKKASLYQHGKWKSENGETRVTLILHGLHSHPFLMLHLAEIAQKTNRGSVFSLYVSYDEDNHGFHRALLKQAIDHIEKMIRDEDCSLKGIVLVGHSMGAIEAAYTAFVDHDKRILSIISIAGRLKVVESIHSPCSESLKDTVDKIYEGVLSNPALPLYQIVGRHDWNASLESTLIRQDHDCYHIVEDGMHFNILFHEDIYRKFPEFLQKSFEKKIDF